MTMHASDAVERERADAATGPQAGRATGRTMRFALGPMRLSLSASTAIVVAVAVLLLLGLGTRIAGFLLLAYAAVLLVFLDWGAANIIQRGYFGFLGDLDLVLAVLGLFLFTAGGGRIGFDGSIHTSRIRRKNDRLIA